MKYGYRVETECLGKWHKILEASSQFCEGFLYARKDYAPRLPYRLVRSDGKIIEEVKGREDVNIGQIAKRGSEPLAPKSND